MKYSLRNELPLLFIVFLPFVYLFMIWNTLPDIVPIHWNSDGMADGHGRKEKLFWVPFLLPVLTYVLFLSAPLVDPKQKLQNMGEKLTKLKFALTFFMSVLALFIIHAARQQEMDPGRLTILAGALYAVSGNFFPTLKPNYFIGIRIPWTLNDEHNWKRTHQFAGKLWLVGGLSVIAYGLFAKPEMNKLFFIVVTFVISVVPTIYSYSSYKKHKEQKG